MIIWSGWGLLVAVIAFGVSLVMELVTERTVGDQQFYQTHAWSLSLALALSGAIVWGVGKYLDAHHRFFFVPMHYWGPLLVALSALPFILR